MAGRPKIYNDDTVLDKAAKVFWEKGYENASADDLLKEMGIGKGSFYLAFKGGKQELFEKTMRRIADQYFVAFRQVVSDCEQPVQLIHDFFLSLAGAKSPIGNKGCYFGNALVQITNKETGLKALAAGHLHLLETIFTEAMQRGKKLGLLQSDQTAKTLGTYLINLWNGINVTKRMETDSKVLTKIIKLNLKIIE
jgi:TetR/AcrR family transcriptional repressor of nem operon